MAKNNKQHNNKFMSTEKKGDTIFNCSLFKFGKSNGWEYKYNWIADSSHFDDDFENRINIDSWFVNCECDCDGQMIQQKKKINCNHKMENHKNLCVCSDCVIAFLLVESKPWKDCLALDTFIFSLSSQFNTQKSFTLNSFFFSFFLYMLSLPMCRTVPCRPLSIFKHQRPFYVGIIIV